jgi:hypothetical protein
MVRLPTFTTNQVAIAALEVVLHEKSLSAVH